MASWEGRDTRAPAVGDAMTSARCRLVDWESARDFLALQALPMEIFHHAVASPCQRSYRDSSQWTRNFLVEQSSAGAGDDGKVRTFSARIPGGCQGLSARGPVHPSHLPKLSSAGTEYLRVWRQHEGRRKACSNFQMRQTGRTGLQAHWGAYCNRFASMYQRRVLLATRGMARAPCSSREGMSECTLAGQRAW